MSLNSLFRKVVRRPAKKHPPRHRKIRFDSLEDRIAPANGSVTFQANTSAFLESAAAQVVINLVTNNVDLNNNVHVDVSDTGTGTATSGGVDYNTFATTTLTFTPADSFTLSGDGNNRTYSKTVAVTLVDDQLVEALENIRFNLGNLVVDGTDSVAFGTQNHRLDINENDSAKVTYAGTADTSESGTTGNVSATLSLITIGTGTVALATPVSATITSPTSDFTASTVTWNAGDTPDTRSITVTATNDQLVEASPENLTGAHSVTTLAIFATEGTAAVNVTDNDTATVSIVGGTTTVSEGGVSQNVQATLTLTTDGTGDAKLAVPISANLPGNADYSAVGVTFAVDSASGATADIVVTAVDDQRVETTTETFADQALAITSTGGAIVNATGSETIVVNENDSATVSIVGGTTGVTEGGSSQNVVATLTLNTTGSDTQVLDVSISANLPGNLDYSSTAATFAAGALSGATANVVVSAVNDRLVEVITETFSSQNLAITDNGGADVNATGSETVAVTDNDSATVSIVGGTTSVTEGGPTQDVVATLTLTTDGIGDAKLAVPVSANLPTLNPDYTANGVTFAVDSTDGNTANVVVSAVDDQLVEAEIETFTDQALAITDSGGANVNATGSETVVVTDNDSATVAITTGTTIVTEGGLTQLVTATLTLNTPGSGGASLAVPVTVNLAPGDGNIDFNTLAATFLVGSGNGATVDIGVAAINDRLVEVITELGAGGPQNLVITEDNGANVAVDGGSGIRTIDVTDNDSATVSIVGGTTGVTEGGSSQNVIATLNLITDGIGDAELAVSVSANLPGNDDYTSTPASFGVGSDHGVTANVVVTAFNDRLVEANTETFAGQALTITDSGGADVNAAGSETVVVTENDSAVVSIVGGTTSVTEGGSSQNVIATLNLITDGAGDSELAVAVSANLPGNLDYAATAADFAVGSEHGATANVVVLAVNDQRVEPLETFAGQALAITTGGGSNITATGSETVVVTDNDSATVAITTGTTTATEGGVTESVIVTLTLNTSGSGTAALEMPVTVNLTPGDLDVDFTRTAATFAAESGNGATVSIGVTAVDDRRVEVITETNVGGPQTLEITEDNGAAVTVSGTSGARTIDIADNDSATVSVTSGLTTAVEGGSDQNVVATLTLNTSGVGAPSTAVLDVEVRANLPGNADYSATEATFAAGSVGGDTANVVVSAVNDRLVEAITESFLAQNLAITSSGGASVAATGNRDIAVTDNESATISIVPGVTGVTEGGSSQNVAATLAISSDGFGDEKLAVEIQANLPTGNADYTATAAVFAIDSIHGATANVVVSAANDRLVEVITESFVGEPLSITVSGGADVAAAGTQDVLVTDNDSATVTVAGGTTTATEGGAVVNVVTTLTLQTDGSGPEQLAVPVSVNLPGNADYSASAATFGVGSGPGLTANVAVTAVNDRAVEPFTESFASQALEITSSGGANVAATGSRTIAVIDNDRAVVDFSGTAGLTEGALNLSTLTATLSLLTDGTGTIQLDTPVSATVTSSTNDFAAATVTWSAGDTPGAKDIALTVIDDRIVEASTESLTANLVPASAATVQATGAATVNVGENDSASVAITSPGTTTVTEGGSSANVGITLTLSALGTGAVELGVPITVNLPTGNADYTQTSATFAAGALNGATVNVGVSAVDDAIVEAQETFSGQALAATSTASVTALGAQSIQVNDNDTATFTIGDVTVDEGAGTATFTVSLDKVLDIPISIDVSYGGGSATGGGEDYDSATDTVSFAAGSTTSQVVTVAITDDSSPEPTETFVASLGSLTSLGGRSVNLDDTGIGTIIDNDNNAPTVNDRSMSLAEDTSISSTLTGTDADNDPLTFHIVTGPAHGTVNLDSQTGAFTYTPAGNYSGSDSFTYKANDGNQDSNTATVSLTITGVNDAPVANSGSATTDEDTAFNGTMSATDVDTGAVLTFSIVSGPTRGTISGFDSSTGAFTYIPNQNYNGSDSFTFKANDGTVDSNIATFSISINAVNDAPAAIDTNASTNEDTTLTGAVTASDVDGDTLTYSLFGGTSAEAGTVTLASNGTFVFTPAANFNGSTSFTFRANDGTVDSNIGSVTITVNAVNDAPVAQNGSASADEDTAVNGTLSAADVDAGAIVTFSIVAGPAHGTLSGFDSSTGAFTYTPNSNFNGSDSFTFKANDGTVDSNTATFSITVNAVNDAPVALDASHSTNEDTSLVGALTATDVDGNSLTYSLVAAPSSGAGTVTVASNGTFVFTPAANFNGPASFTFKANDGTVDSNIATINVTVNAVNDAPVAQNGSASTDEDTSVTGTLTATDVDLGLNLTFSIVSGPAHGTISGFDSLTGTFTYTPASNYNGPDSFTFIANDGNVDSNTATFSITVDAVNDAPVAQGGSATTNEDATLIGAVSATDVDGNQLTYSLVSGPAGGAGAVSVNSNGTFVFTPSANFNGSTSFTFKANDGAVDSNTATVNITVTAVNDAPVANNGSASTNEDIAVSGTLTGTDVDAGAILTFSIVANPAHGTISGFDSATGAFTYTPALNYNGPDSFTFKANDGTADSNIATVTLNVAAVNDNPTANNDNVLVGEDSGVNSLSVLVNDSGAPDASETLTVISTGTASHGTVAVGPGGTTVLYTPAPNYNGPDSFTYTISDGNGGTSTATVNVTVTGSNDLPSATNDSATMVEDGVPQTIDVLANDSSSPDIGETLTIISVTQGQHGTVTIAPGNLSLTYTPNANFAGSDTFLYTISDGNGGTAIAAVTIEVTNDAADRLEVITTTGVTSFTEPTSGAAVAVVVDAGVRVGSAFQGVIKQATVRIGSGYVRGKDKLTFTNTPKIKGLFNGVTGTLTLTGVATPAEYQAALRTVKFVNNSPAPVDGIRVVSFKVQDAAGVGTEAAKLVQVTGVNSKPVLTLPTTTVTYRRGAVPVAIAPTLTIKDVDNTRLQSARVVIGAGFAANLDVLSVVSKPGIIANYNATTGILTLTGNATLATYVTVLRSLKFKTTATTTGLRTISITVNDGIEDSVAVNRTVNVI